MPGIDSNTVHGPINRHITEYLTTTLGVKQYKCKTLQNPDYYYDGQVFNPVDVGYRKNTVTDKAGAIWLRDKAIVSVGTKQTDDAYKLFGLRPDENQSGSESFEVSIESIEVSGKTQTINLRDRVEVSPITTKFGDNLYLQRARQRSRVMVAATNADDGFRIALRLHLKGLTPIYRDDLDEYWIFNDKGQFRFRLGKPYLVDPETMNPLHEEMDNSYLDLVKHFLTEISKGEYLYVKEPTEAFGKVDLPSSFLIDADTVYSSASDGSVRNVDDDISWASARGATAGTSVQDTSSSLQSAMFSARDSMPHWSVYRSFFYFDTSGVTGPVYSASINLKSITLADSAVCVMKGEQGDPLVVGDFDAFSGVLYGYKAWLANSLNTIDFDAGGIADINLAGVTKICTREYTYDYLDSEPANETEWNNSCTYAESSGTTNDPYLYCSVYVAVLKKISGISLGTIDSINGVPVGTISSLVG